MVVTGHHVGLEQTDMSAETDHAQAAPSMLNAQYQWIGPEQVAAFLQAHPAVVPALDRLHACLAGTFAGAHFVLRHLTSAQVPSTAGDGHLLVVVATDYRGDAAEGLGAVLREWGARHEEARTFVLVAVASEAVDPYADDAEARALYIRLRSDGYMRYLDAARRFLSDRTDSEERALAGAELFAATLRESGPRLDRRGGDPREVLERLRRREAGADVG